MTRIETLPPPNPSSPQARRKEKHTGLTQWTREAGGPFSTGAFWRAECVGAATPLRAPVAAQKRAVSLLWSCCVTDGY